MANPFVVPTALSAAVLAACFGLANRAGAAPETRGTQCTVAVSSTHAPVSSRGTATASTSAPLRHTVTSSLRPIASSTINC